MTKQRSRGQVHVGIGDGVGNFINADLPCGQRSRIKLRPHCILLRAKNLYLRHAAHHREALRNGCFCRLIHVRKP